MKKLLTLLFVSTLLISTIGCSSDDDAAAIDPSARITLNRENLQLHSPYRIDQFIATRFDVGSNGYTLQQVSNQATGLLENSIFTFNANGSGTVTDQSGNQGSFLYNITIDNTLILEYQGTGAVTEEYYDVTLNGLGEMTFIVEGFNVAMDQNNSVLVTGTVELD